MNIAQDNIFGPETKKALVKALQIELNKQFNADLDINGIFGIKTKGACVNIRVGARGNITLILQSILFIRGYNIIINGVFDENTGNIVAQFQSDNKLSVDKIAGKNTFDKLFN